MSNKQNQARTGIALYQPEVDRQVTRLVYRGDAEHLVPGTHLTMNELHEYQLVGRRLQARAVASAFKGLFTGLLRPLKKVTGNYARVSREAAAIRQLSALDEHLLADIGINRGQIRAAVAGLLNRPTAQATPAAAVEPLGSVPRATSDEPQARQAA